MDPDGTFNCKYFIISSRQAETQLPEQYPRFGHVVSGMDVVQKINALAPASGDGPPARKGHDGNGDRHRQACRRRRP